jgi:FlaA1/EpsC-like NDP-sugar epimerase
MRPSARSIKQDFMGPIGEIGRRMGRKCAEDCLREENRRKIAFAKKIDGRSHMLKQATWNSVSQSDENPLRAHDVRDERRMSSV